MAPLNKTIACVVLVALFTVASSKFCSLKFKDCGSKQGKLDSVEINETCSSSSDAILVRGTTVQINFTFSADVAESTLTSKVSGEVKGLPFFVPFPLDNADACKDSGLTCPIKANTKYNYLSLLQVKKQFPAIGVVVKWELLDKNNVNVFCAEINASLK